MIKPSQKTVDFEKMSADLKAIAGSFAPRFTRQTVEIRKARKSAGIKRRAFIDTVYSITSKNTNFLPAYFNVVEFEARVLESRELMQVQNTLKKLSEYIRNVEIIVCNQTYTNALSVYHSLRDAAKNGQSGAKPLYMRLKKMFPNGRRQPAKTPPADSVE